MIEPKKNTFSYEQLAVSPCEKQDVGEVMRIIKDTQMDIWLIGEIDYHKYFIVRDSLTGKIALCFAFSQEADVGILKNLACAKEYQRRGIGTYIVNEKIPSIARDLGIKRLYLHGNNRKVYTSHFFWNKTIYSHIKSKAVKDAYYKKYFNYLVENYSDEVLSAESIFYLDITKHFNGAI